MFRRLLTISFMVASAVTFADYDYVLNVNGKTLSVNSGHWAQNDELTYSTDASGDKYIVLGSTHGGRIDFDLPLDGNTNLVSDWLEGIGFTGGLAQRDLKTGNARGVRWERCDPVELILPSVDLFATGGPKTGAGIQMTYAARGKKLFVGNLPFSKDDKRGRPAVEIAHAEVTMSQTQADGSVARMQLNGIGRTGTMRISRSPGADATCSDFYLNARSGSPAAIALQEWFTMSAITGEERNLEVTYYSKKGALGTFTLIGCGLKRCGLNGDLDGDGEADISAAVYVQRVKWASSNPSDG